MILTKSPYRYAVCLCIIINSIISIQWSSFINHIKNQTKRKKLNKISEIINNIIIRNNKIIILGGDGGPVVKVLGRLKNSG